MAATLTTPGSVLSHMSAAAAYGIWSWADRTRCTGALFAAS
jgi:hypothetical protein